VKVKFEYDRQVSRIIWQMSIATYLFIHTLDRISSLLRFQKLIRDLQDVSAERGRDISLHLISLAFKLTYDRYPDLRSLSPLVFGTVFVLVLPLGNVPIVMYPRVRMKLVGLGCIRW
jgi:hypothetical protein